jgi:CubicO group peptidase (beta-lactamase class C family)
MPSLEELFQAACDIGKISGAVLLATNRTGKYLITFIFYPSCLPLDDTGSFTYSKAFGIRFLEQEQEPLEIDAVMLLASCSKLLTTIAALQCVEDGLVGLDNDLSDLLPELAKLGILSDTNSEVTGGKPVLKKRENEITLR